MMVAMAALQVFIVRFFFQVSSTMDFQSVKKLMVSGQGARKGYV